MDKMKKEEDCFLDLLGFILFCVPIFTKLNINIFENRFKYVEQVKKMGAVIKIDGMSIIIDGVNHFIN